MKKPSIQQTLNIIQLVMLLVELFKRKKNDGVSKG
jgi:hypothetical protein